MESHIDKKFYVPEIAEFHVGFEYEEKSSGLWTPQTYNEFSPIINQEILTENDDWADTIAGYIKCQIIRVKYLDREDIESLGFKFDKWWISEEKGSIYAFDFYGLTFYHESKTIKIWLRDTGEDIFSGTIKNKSELKRLLKQLRI